VIPGRAMEWNNEVNCFTSRRSEVWGETNGQTGRGNRNPELGDGNIAENPG